MRKAIVSAAIAAGLVLGATSPAIAAGNSGEAQLHPGHRGYVASEGQGGGIPTAHFAAHGGPGYPAGPGGWGGAVSDAAVACGGLPNAHSGC